MSGRIHVEISEKPLSLDAAQRFVADDAHGAFNSFVGMVRARNLGRDVLGVSYDIFEPLAIATLQRLCEAVKGEYDGRINIYIAHAKGRLAVGETSVIIAVTTPHRAESFAACRRLIEALKHEAPIWKQEHYTDGNSEWVQGHALCQHTEQA